MARNCTIPADFWTWEAVIDCAPMTRLLFIGLWNFADGGGVQPLRPRTIRLQVFPGDEIGNDAVRAMIDELAAQKLVRIYEIDGQEYLSIVDWEQIQRVGKHARRRYPPFPSPRAAEVDERLPDSTPDTVAVEFPRSASRPSAAAAPRGEEAEPPPDDTYLIASQISNPPSPVRLSNSGP